MFLSDEGPTLETLDFTIRIGSTPTFVYLDLYLYKDFFIKPFLQDATKTCDKIVYCKQVY